MPPRRTALLLLTLVGLLPAAHAQVSTESPFAPPGSAARTDAASAPSQIGDYEFVGVMRLGGKAIFGFSKRDGRSVWVEEGAEKEGVAVVARLGVDAVSVRIGGTLAEMKLKSPNSGTSPHTAPPSPLAAVQPPLPGGAAPGTPQNASKAQIAEQEREARMLVSDLLEIGMQQRKAYEEAQKRKGNAAAGGPVPAPTATK
ncbi:hypothetical protein [Nibricoccus sp. IMCC34717]|uniref:hypothetical protein n=1 Tax=Nibricoccus sp. IMCC34717 TaxID=3034021 RepID=UPI00384C89B4